MSSIFVFKKMTSVMMEVSWELEMFGRWKGEIVGVFFTGKI
jgi:hypothetical protein